MRRPGAVFAVINMVTKTALAIDGAVARAGIGSFGERATGLTVGREFGSGLSLTGSGLLTNVKGGDLYYPEFDMPATNNGVVHGLDWEHGISDTNIGDRPDPRGPLSWLSSSEVSLRVTSLFDVSYATPTSSANVQDAIAADGRTYALHLEWRF